MTILKGYLTYILAALTILGAGSGYVLGVVDGEHAAAMVWAGLALFGVRRAIG
jgi:hypothetical protein